MFGYYEYPSKRKEPQHILKIVGQGILFEGVCVTASVAISAQGCGQVSLPQRSHTQVGDVCPDPSLSVRRSSVKYPQGPTMCTCP